MARSTKSKRKRNSVAARSERRTAPASKQQAACVVAGEVSQHVGKADPAAPRMEACDTARDIGDPSPTPARQEECEALRGGERSATVTTVMRQVGLEVLREDWEPVSWARALVEGNGSRDDTLSHYARFRVAELTAKEGDRQLRKQDFDARHRDRFQDLDSLTKVPAGEAPSWTVAACMDAVFWHLVAMLAGAGTLIGAQILWPGIEFGVSWIVLVAAMQLIPSAIWYIGRRGFFTVSYPQVAQMTACVAVLGSVVVGCGLLVNEPKLHGVKTGQRAAGGADGLLGFSTVGSNRSLAPASADSNAAHEVVESMGTPSTSLPE